MQLKQFQVFCPVEGEQFWIWPLAKHKQQLLYQAASNNVKSAICYTSSENKEAQIWFKVSEAQTEIQTIWTSWETGTLYKKKIPEFRKIKQQ